MTDLTEKDLLMKVTHVRCVMCGFEDTVQNLGVDVEDFSDHDEYTYYDLVCCNDPVPTAVIKSDSPVIGDEAIDQDRWHYGEERYTYEVDDNLLEEAGIS